MQILYDALGQYPPIITVALIVAVAVQFVMLIVITYILSKQHERMYRFFGGKAKRRNLEAMLDEYLKKVLRVEAKYNEVLALTDDINARMITCIRKIGVVRYNPFDEMGADISFALALLDENDDGVVISTIHSRDASYTYAKQVLNGSSLHTLTDEEKEAVHVALEWKPIVDMGEHRRNRERRVAETKKNRHRRQEQASHVSMQSGRPENEVYADKEHESEELANRRAVERFTAKLANRPKKTED